MRHKRFIVSILASLGLLLGLATGTPAQMPHAEPQQAPVETGEFHRIEQPLWVKAAVTAGGLGLIGLELWWFMLSQPKSRKVSSRESS
ncbi:MAG: hypothetical protein ICV62_03950 [Cyanobacteria bacterium Co-bin13]|nr:hypothetical protein [Cyanobacteria bacterium Co-bin13]